MYPYYNSSHYNQRYPHHYYQTNPFLSNADSFVYGGRIFTRLVIRFLLVLLNILAVDGLARCDPHLGLREVLEVVHIT